jgi:hypothetical protein
MSAGNRFHKAGLVNGDASEIEDVTGNTLGHDPEGEITNFDDARNQSDTGSVNIEKVAQLAMLCAAGMPSDKDFNAIKKRVGVAGNEVADDNDGTQLVANASSSGLPRDPDYRNDAFSQQIEMAGDKSDYSAGLQAIESSIRVVPRPSLMRGRTSRTIRLSIPVLMVVGAMFAWRSWGDEAEEMVKRWTSSMGWVSSVSATNSPPAIAATSASPEMAQRPQPAAPDVAVAHHSREQPAATQEQTPAIAPEQNIRSKASSPPPHVRAKRTPVPETRPTTIEGWTLREVSDGAAVLEGPNGTWRVRRGDSVPGVGRVESIVLWGKRWIVATSKGLISTP